MLYPKYEWRVPPPNQEAARRLAEELSISPLTASLMAVRGIESIEAAEQFLHGSAQHSHDPMLLHGMEQAVPRIRKALQEQEHILIYGDYDADGVSSTTLMIQLMRHLEASYDIYIPHRSNEGYGLHNHAIDWAYQQGVSLIITVDTGISAVEQIAYANRLGIDVIVTDHHEPPEVLPDAYALINPKLPHCRYPFKGLAGVGVAYKLAQALVEDPPEEWLQIVAIGTIADLMPLLEENRMLVRQGLESMRTTRYEGLRSLLSVSGIDVPQVTSVHIAFSVAPRINAAGRMDHAGKAVTLLTTSNREDAERLAWELDALNKKRQQTVDNIADEALGLIQSRFSPEQLPPVLVVAGEGWNEGVVGIVASRLLEKFYRPVIVLGIDPESGQCKGSARSIPGLDIYEALHHCKDVLEHFGGHPAAAGMSLHRDRLPMLEEGLWSFAKQVLTDDHLIPVQQADLECSIREITLAGLDELELLGPYGMSNTVPKMVFREVTVIEARKMGKESRHLRLRLQQEQGVLEAVGFGYGHLADVLPSGTSISVLGEMSVNEWNGSRKPQLLIQDLAVPQKQVFDLRNTAEPIRELQRFRAQWERELRCPEPRCAVVMKESRLSEVKEELSNLSLWVYDRTAGFRPGSSLAKESRLEDLSVMFMVDLPDSLDELDSLLAAFRDVPNIVLLHSARDPQERLQVPTREQFKTLYAVLAGLGSRPASSKDVVASMKKHSALSDAMLSQVLKVFEELAFIQVSEGHIYFVPKPEKKPLEASAHFRSLTRLAEMEQYMKFGSADQVRHWMYSRTAGAS
ncbi:single-stranded-DNA-specific exonuclease RecJ [Paenibacillus algicola]|uniref:single-stranded-DNA-specific exonuclease RecJ n=1 Tax=Paenibacillus algicola TaxID=2565926 RepID=UPI0010FE8B00|nr:single-stranded-DNA-specific exonuclease RecJ [Paenibacillus algicola]